MPVLAGLRVIDLTQGRSGPFCTMLLGAFGAEVIKVEPPGVGDVTRREGPFFHDEPHPERSVPFLYLNRNKLSATLAIDKELGRTLLLKLVRTADVVVESFPPRVMASMGLDSSVLIEENPSVILTSVTNFGQTGPYRNFRGEEIILDALAGWAYVTGFPDREPLKAGAYQAQYATGLNAAFHTVAAVNARLLTGEGRHLDVSAFETAVHWMSGSIAMYSHDAQVRVRAGSWTGMVRGASTPRSHPTEIYECQDGYVAVAVQSPAQWEMFALLLGLPELKDDPRFNTDYASRGRHARELNALVAPWFKARTRAGIFQLCGEYRVPAGMVYEAQEILQDPQHQEASFFQELEHPEVGTLPYAKSPIRGDEMEWQMRRAPLLGEHNREVYEGRLGCSHHEFLGLRALGVV